jgi:protease I
MKKSPALAVSGRTNKKTPLSGKRVAILVADGFEEVELTEPREALRKAGAVADIVSPVAKVVKAMRHANHGKVLAVQVALGRAKAKDYDALLLPGGLMNPDALRQEPKAVKFVQAFFKARKPVAAICHGPQLLIEADVVRGRRMTSFPSVQTDLRNAGAKWADKTVIVDGNLVTSRKPADLPAFNREMIKAIASG